jgi:hypothetical protein
MGKTAANAENASPSDGAGWSPAPSSSSAQPDGENGQLSGLPELGHRVPKEVVGLARGVQSRSEQLGDSRGALRRGRQP